MRKLKPNEETFPVHPVGIRYKCEICGKGEMKADENGMVLTTNPPLYPHKCTECGGTMNLPGIYPMIEWVPDEESISVDIEASEILDSLRQGINVYQKEGIDNETT